MYGIETAEVAGAVAFAPPKLLFLWRAYLCTYFVSCLFRTHPSSLDFELNLPSISSVKRILDAREHIPLDQQLRALAGVDTITNILIVVVNDMASSEAETRAARVDALEVVSNEGDGEMAGIFLAVRVGMSNQHCLVVIVDITVGDGNKVRAVGHVDKSIIVVFALGLVRRYVDVVNPDVLGVVNPDGITGLGDDFGDYEVAEKDRG